MCERVPSRAGSTDHAPRLPAVFAEPSTWPRWSRPSRSGPDNRFALDSARWAGHNLDLGDLSWPAERAYGPAGFRKSDRCSYRSRTPVSLAVVVPPGGWPGSLETRDAATQGLHQDGLLSSRMVHPFALLDLSVQTALTGSGGAELTRSPPASANHNEKAAWGRFLIYSQGVGR